CFSFQAGDGIRARNVTAVQTCALPILFVIPQHSGSMVIAVIIAFLILIFMSTARSGMYTPIPEAKIPMAITGTAMGICSAVGYRSGERRVGEERSASDGGAR